MLSSSSDLELQRLKQAKKVQMPCTFPPVAKENFRMNTCNRGKFSSDLADRWIDAMLERYEAVWQTVHSSYLRKNNSLHSQTWWIKARYNPLPQCTKSKVYDQSLLQPSYCWEYYKLSTTFSSHDVSIKWMKIWNEWKYMKVMKITQEWNLTPYTKGKQTALLHFWSIKFANWHKFSKTSPT